MRCTYLFCCVQRIFSVLRQTKRGGMIMNGIGTGNYPVDFGKLLMANGDAMDFFTSLSDEQRIAVEAECQLMGSSEEMRAYVARMASKRKK